MSRKSKLKETAQTPLSLMIGEVNALLEETRYSESSKRHYNSIYNVFKEFSSSEYYSDEEGARFLIEYYSIQLKEKDPHKLSSHKTNAFRAMMLLSDYSKNKSITQRHSRKIDELLWPDSTLAEFGQFFRSGTFLGWSKSYQDNCVRQFKKFAAFLKEKGIKSCNEITAITLSQYYSDKLKGYQPQTIAVVFGLFRAFFRFLYITEAHPQDLSEVFPSIRKRPPSLPHIWHDGDIDKVLNCIDRGNPTESRDYAIILLIVRLGLRISDVKNLKLDDIRWERNCIEIIQQKTKEPLVLPLLQDVGEAIIEYLKYHRPATDKRNVFISHSAPFEPFTEQTHFHGQFSKYLTRAGINISSDKAHGVHSLRHALAVKLIENNISLLTVKEILGHGDINSAANYLRVDVELLRQCALSPGGVY